MRTDLARHTGLIDHALALKAISADRSAICTAAAYYRAVARILQPSRGRIVYLRGGTVHAREETSA